MTATVPPRCTYTDPGRPSVNHPDNPLVPPWQCTREAGHDGGHARVPICPGTVRVRSGGALWPCVLAAGHPGGCCPHGASRWLGRPPREMDREELVQSIGLMTAEIECGEVNARQMNERLMSWERRVLAVANHVLDNARSPHSNNHTEDCWLKHPHCLAFAIIGSYGLEKAERHLAGTNAPEPEPQGDLLALLPEEVGA